MIGGALLIVIAQYVIICFADIRVIQTAENTNDRLTEKAAVAVLSERPDNIYQTIRVSIRFGGAFTDSTAWLFSQLKPAQQEEVLEAYFGDSGHRYSLCRLPMGSTDFALEHFNCDNTTNDYELEDFSIEHDVKYIIPMIRRAAGKRAASLSGNSELEFLSTPWSPPAWMKRNNRMSNSLMPGLRQEPEVFSSWALYFSKYITAYKEAGVDISYVTVQNEPHVAKQFAVTYECCGFEPEHERDFLRDYLGPRLAADHPQVKIYIHDDQKNDRMVEMVDAVMSDPAAAQYVDGVAFHWYDNWGENYDILDEVHSMYPQLSLLGTEATLMRPAAQPLPWNGGFWEQGQKYAIDILRDLNHHAEGWIDWNMLLDLFGGPSSQHLGRLKDLGNCDAPIRLNFTGYPYADEESGDGSLLYQPAYWHYGHFTRYIPPQSVRVGSELETTLTSAAGPTAGAADEDDVGNDAREVEFVAVTTPSSELVVVVLNKYDTELSYNLHVPDYGYAVMTMPPQSIQTLILEL